MIIIKAGTRERDVHKEYVENTLEALQKEVDGYIEVTTLPELSEHGIQMIVNEEGLLNGLPINENLLPFFYNGNVLFVSTHEDEFASLSLEQEVFVWNWLIGLIDTIKHTKS